MILVTGGCAGFFGTNFVLNWLTQYSEEFINLNVLTYAGNRENLASLAEDARHISMWGDIGDSVLVTSLPAQHQSLVKDNLVRACQRIPFTCSSSRKIATGQKQIAKRLRLKSASMAKRRYPHA